MKILFISEDLVAGDLARKLVKEGHLVKLYIHDKGRSENFQGIIPKINNWKDELSWVEKDGLIVFDGCCWGKIQDKLRKNGYSCVGGGEIGEKLENDRKFGSDMFEKYGIKTAPLFNFNNIDEAISFLKRGGGKWVIKQNGDGTSLKGFNYVGLMENAEDVIDVLENYKQKAEYCNQIITLHKKIDGIEIGVGRYFNGNDWVGPIEYNLEHKKFFPGDLGPTTSEMGTLAWYNNNESNKLYKETLAKMTPLLKESGFKGDMEIDCIVNENGAFPLEATPRFGSPIIHLQSEIQTTPWGEMLKALADEKDYEVKWKEGYGIVIVVTVPTSQPFPFTKAEHYISPKGIKIYFDEVAQKNMEHIHFEDVSMRKVKGKEEYYISDDRGYVLYVTAVGKTAEEARKKAHELITHIHIPKMFYRNDIGLKFAEKDQALLKKWGYI